MALATINALISNAIPEQGRVKLPPPKKKKKHREEKRRMRRGRQTSNTVAVRDATGMGSGRRGSWRRVERQRRGAQPIRDEGNTKAAEPHPENPQPPLSGERTSAGARGYTLSTWVQPTRTPIAGSQGVGDLGRCGREGPLPQPRITVVRY